MITPETHAKLNDPAVLAARDAGLAKLEEVFAGKTFADGFHLCGSEPTTSNVDIDWEKWLDDSLTHLAAEADKSTDESVFRPLCITFNPRGVHHVDHLFGAEVFDLAEDNWQCHPLDTPIGELPAVDLASHPAWRKMQDFARAFVQRDVRSVLLSLPTIASALNIAVNLYGQRILAAMHDAPDAARRDLRVINDLLCQMHCWYRAFLPAEQLQCICPGGRCQPIGFGQICGCTSQLISPEMYRRFIAPLDEQVLNVYPRGGMIHLCGAHTQHIPVWREMAVMRSFQLNDRAAEDLETYVRELRDDQVFYVNPTDTMTPERILSITGGNRCVIAAERS